MKIANVKYQILTAVAFFISLIIFFVPFHAFLTVWLASLVGHYTGLRLWKEVLLLVCVSGVLFLLVTDNKIRFHTLTRRLVWLIAIYVIVQLLWGVVAYDRHQVTAKALLYGWLVDIRPLLFFLLAWAVSVRTARLRLAWRPILLIPAAVVVSIGLLQLTVLPHDVLRHFGYGPSTIPVSETVNSNAAYPRLQSTLRGPNPLGAYLIVIIAALTSLIIRRPKLRGAKAVFLAAAIIVLVFSYSRSALLGGLLSVGVVLGISLRSRPGGRKFAVPAAAALLLLATAGFGLRHNVYFENLVLHTQTRSVVATTSDGAHNSALRQGLRDLIHQPTGRGPGTAGPASVYNAGRTRIAENYFLQLGQELGWVGLVLFAAITAGIGYLLWVRRSDPLALTLLASLIGLTFVNLLSHAWTDDTVAYVWWGLAGMAMATTAGQANDEPG